MPPPICWRAREPPRRMLASCSSHEPTRPRLPGERSSCRVATASASAHARRWRPCSSACSSGGRGRGDAHGERRVGAASASGAPASHARRAAGGQRSRDGQTVDGWRPHLPGMERCVSVHAGSSQRARGRSLRDAVAAWRSGEQRKASGAACLQRRGWTRCLKRRPGGRYFKYRPPLGQFQPSDGRCAGEDRLGIAAISKGAEPVVVPRQGRRGGCAVRHGGGTWPRSAGKFGAAASPSH